MHDIDPFRLLGVSVHADAQTVRERYLELSRVYHPDRCGGSPRATSAFQAISKAYATLQDPQARAAAERALALRDPLRLTEDPRLLRAADGVAALWSLAERKRRPALPAAGQGRDLRVVHTIPWVRAALGGTETVVAAWHMPCGSCAGTGSRSLEAEPRCHVCQGTGAWLVGVRRRRHICEFCQGRGLVVLRPCETCAGEGSRHQSHQAEVPIPPRCRDGALLRIRGGGEPPMDGLAGARPGDLVVDIRVEPDARWQVDGDDVIARLPVSLWEALAGGVVDVPTLEGWQRLRLPAQSASGQELRVQGHGLPALRGSGRGTLRYRIEIALPTAIDSDTQERLRALFASLPRQAHPQIDACRPPEAAP